MQLKTLAFASALAFNTIIVSPGNG